ncbi:MAG: hypothetical protein HYW48_01735 [Deltaproteobacteria bacterium]|nr:hypothetical protein [Deltaproteobacteria bacterium]
MTSPVYFNRKPYTVTYKDWHTGELVRVKRRPSTLEHNIFPLDIVELKQTKNVDWQEGDEFEVKHISDRSPNVLQIQNDDGEATFVEAYDVTLEEEVAPRGKRSIDDPKRNKYLNWP